MADVTRRIGLSLGADICWPLCFEALVKRLGPLEVGGDVVRFDVERVTIEPFDLRGRCRYDVVLDRLTHWYYPSREWIKKVVLMDGVYVLNHPWSIQSMEKQTTYCAMMRLGLPVPDTWMLPPKDYEERDDLRVTLQRYARLFDLGVVGRELGYPMFMKPYDGGAWKGVSRITDERGLRAAYEQSGRMLMHLQRSVEGYDLFIRCLGMGPQTRIMAYDPSAPLHARYVVGTPEMGADERRLLVDMTLTINAFFGWDFNSCEALRKDGVFHPIDFANACPDSQVTSLHFHFPWLIGAQLRWALFCAATKRPFRLNLDWQPFFDIADRDPEMSLAERLAAYGAVARVRFDAARFEDFCAEHLPHLDDLLHEFFGTAEARAAVRQKVAALFPPHEVEEFTEHFWQRIQSWRAGEGAPAEHDS